LVPLPLFACLWLSSYSWSAARTCKAAHFASGCCAAIAAVFKLILMPIPVTFWLASAAWAIAREGRPPGTVLRDQLLPATTGVVVVFGAVTAYFAMLGALPEFLWTNLGYPVQAVATTTNVLDWERLLFSAGWYAFTFAPWLLFAALGLTGCRGDRRDLVTLQLALWLLVGTALIVAQRLSWWSYHFLLLILPLGILALRGIDAVSIRLAGGGAVDRRRLVPLVAVLAYAPLTAGLQGLFGKVQPVIALSVMGDTDLVGYRGWVEPEYYQIWRDTRFLVGPGALPGPIYVFGDPRYYLLSGRTQAIPIHGWTVYLLPWQRRRQAELLEASRPAYIFASPQTEQTIFALSPQLKALIDHAYEPLSSSDQGTWYRLFGEAKGTRLSPDGDTVSEPEGSVALSGDCTARGFWDTGLEPTRPGPRVKAARP
ncbi:MAG TPA: hypothetical protein VFY87_16590, partial [Geminicoccaceae bacterium]|nr:hypothetical protein [Geminicoccaceae bacterium]